MKVPDLQAFNQVYDKIKVLTEGDFNHSSKETTIKNLYRALAQAHVEGRYRDEHWAGISKLTKTLDELAPFGISWEFDRAYYRKHPDYATKLPNAKIYHFNVMFEDNKGKQHIIPLHVTCSFVGKTGTMTDDVYELTYYFAV